MRVHSSGTILSFYRAESGVTTFSLRQSLGDLTLQRANKQDSGPAKRGKVYIDDVLSDQQLVLMTISAGRSGTMVFEDGTIVKRVPNLKLSVQDLTGRLVVGNSPVTTDDWSGQVKGLAIYDRELTAQEVSQHFALWMNHAQPDLAKGTGAVALYLFNEGRGSVVHSFTTRSIQQRTSLSPSASSCCMRSFLSGRGMSFVQIGITVKTSRSMCVASFLLVSSTMRISYSCKGPNILRLSRSLLVLLSV